MDVNGDGEFGTRKGVHVVVKLSSSSPVVHAAMGIDVPAPGGAMIRTAGATEIAAARTENNKARRAGADEIAIR